MNVIVQKFLNTQVSAQTVRAYKNDIASFIAFVNMPLDMVKEENIVDYRNYLIASGSAIASINRALSTIKAFYQWMVARDHISKSPALLVKKIRTYEESKTPGLSDEEANKLLEAAKANTKYYAIISTLLYCGLRRSELCQIKLSDITIEKNGRALQVLGKGRKPRRIPMSDAVWDAIQQHISATFIGDNLPMLSDCLIFKMHPESIRKIVNKLCKVAGISIVSPHALRATAVSNAIDNGANFVELQYAFGWSNPTMVNRYDKRRAQMKNSAVLKINYGSK